MYELKGRYKGLEIAIRSSDIAKGTMKNEVRELAKGLGMNKVRGLNVWKGKSGYIIVTEGITDEDETLDY